MKVRIKTNDPSQQENITANLIEDEFVTGLRYELMKIFADSYVTIDKRETTVYLSEEDYDRVTSVVLVKFISSMLLDDSDIQPGSTISTIRFPFEGIVKFEKEQ